MLEVQKFIAKSVQETIKGLSTEQADLLIQKFKSASYGEAIGDTEYALLGILPHKAAFDKGVRGWNSFCFKTYKAILGREPEDCRLMGQGFRSQWYGQKVIEAIKELRGELIKA